MTTVCQTCSRVQQPEGFWLPVNEPPQGAVSHGLCPACAEAYRANLRALAAAGDAPKRLQDYPWARAVGCSALHPEDRDSDGGARIVRGEP